ncbi:molybdopterin synthase catalytic subunit [Cognatilysobacter segetis]|uniref:molybdenum cofactor biosynthesis protein MoaE n=1 Tax=Cognatilysobacter segetis TaxID=2492394 RepID=UPI00105B380B
MVRLHTGIVDASSGALDIAAAFEFVADPAFGGYTAFVGRIRDLNHGRRVEAVSYDLFDALALQRFGEIAAETIEDVGPAMRLWIEHAKGRVPVGGVAVVVAVGTPHRDEAFLACRQVIEAVKHTVPIWKQEHYEDGSSEWSEGCSLCHA